MESTDTQSGERPPQGRERSLRKNIQKGFSGLRASHKTAHAGLWLDKYLRKQDVKTGEASDDESTKSSRTTLVREVAEIPVPDIYQTFFKSWQHYLEQEYQARQFIAKAKGKIIVGLGGESVIETGIALHHTYGVPYIPGSSLKGLAATYLRQQIFALQQSNNKYDQLRSKGYKKAQPVIFGQVDKSSDDIDDSKEDSGYIIFLDALYIPSEEQKDDCPLRQDIITVHHQQYYQGSGTPNDYESPIPIPFLAASGSYLIALAAPDLAEGVRQPWLEFTYQILKQALAHNGIGAKTSAGYGRMDLTDKDAMKREEEARKRKEKEEEEARAADRERKEIGSIIREVEAIPPDQVFNNIQQYYKRWEKVKKYRQSALLAEAIVAAVNKTHRKMKEKNAAYYNELKQASQQQ